jgi:hypothetical protein
MPSRRAAASMTRSTAIATMAVAIALAGGATACSNGSNDAGRRPTVASADFDAALVLSVDESGFRWSNGPGNETGVTVDPAAVPFGTVINVVNTGKEEHWVDGGKAFDTGRLQPGDQTVVAFTSDTLATIGATAQTYDIVDRDAPDHRTQIVVSAKPTNP